MTFRPAKRRRKNSVLSSDEEESNTSQPGEQTSAVESSRPPHDGDDAANAKATASRSSIRKSQSGSKKPNKRSTASKTKSAPIYSFFNSASQNHTVDQSLKDALSKAEGHSYDDIEDDALSGTDQNPSVLPRTTSAVIGNQHAGTEKAEASLRQDHHSNAGRKFITDRNSTIELATANTSVQSDRRTLPWVQKYAPVTLEELAVHPKKIADVRAWLSNAFQGRNRKKLLVLRGPAGSGKTMTIDLLSKVMNFDTVEWSNPIGEVYGSETYTSLSSQFEDFLERGSRYGGLKLEEYSSTQPTDTQGAGPTSEHKLVLLDEIPHTLSSSSTNVAAFRTNVLSYIASGIPSFRENQPPAYADREVVPLVILISESSGSLFSDVSDTYTAFRLLGPDLLNHPSTTVIDFNPIAPTILTRALESIIRKEARDSGRRRVPGSAVIKQLSTTGDIRNAVSSLEFMCLKGDNDGDWGDRVAGKQKKTTRGVTKPTKMEEEIIEIMSQRSATLHLFHAVGKVLYNKRQVHDTFSPTFDAPMQPPPYLSHHGRLRISEVNVDRLDDETGAESSMFVAALHENYVLSCSGNDFVDVLNGCIDRISDADLLNTDFSASNARAHARGSITSVGHGISSMRQNAMTFHLATRGLLFELPSPVKRLSVANDDGRGPRRDPYKMYYPVSLRMWKLVEETEGMIDRTCSKSNKGSHTVMTAMTDVGSPETHPPDMGTALSESQQRATRLSMILDTLPYATKIWQNVQTYASDIEQLRSITNFSGDVKYKVEEDNDFATNDTENHQDRKFTAYKASESIRDGSLVDYTRQKLVLSDDDIEDD